MTQEFDSGPGQGDQDDMRLDATLLSHGKKGLRWEGDKSPYYSKSAK